MKCRVCEQRLRKPTPKCHHLERSPIDHRICLGCWLGWLDLEKFVFRATGRTIWTLQVEDAMKTFLRLLDKPAVEAPETTGNTPLIGE